jgi:hypothetical protein
MCGHVTIFDVTDHFFCNLFLTISIADKNKLTGRIEKFYMILLLKGYSMHVLKSSQLVIRRHDVNLKKCRYRKKKKRDLEKILKPAKK